MDVLKSGEITLPIRLNQLQLTIKLISISILILFSIAVSATETTNIDSVENKIEHFLEILNKDKTPTLKDYQWVMGYSDFSEMQMFWKHCYIKLDSAPLRDEDCFNELTNNWVKKDKSPSYYLQWLQNQLPQSHQFTIQSTKQIKLKNKNIGTKVQAKFSNTQIFFWIPNEEDNTKVGNIHVVEINSVPINVLTQQSSEASVLFALGMKTIVRPQTKIERDFESKKIESKCNANPACIKQRKLRKKQNAVHEAEMKQFQKVTNSYKSWCMNNITICEKERAVKNEIFQKKMLLEKECESDFKKCIPQVSKWYKKSRAIPDSFCEKYNEECIKLEKINQAQTKRHNLKNEVNCKEQPKACQSEKSDFDRALSIVKRE